MKINDLKELRTVKKNFTAAPAAAEKAVSRKEHARKASDGHAVKEAAKKPCGPSFVRGQKVRMMDSNDIAVVVSVGDKGCELELDGLVFKAGFGEFLPVNYMEDHELRASVPEKKTAVKDAPARQKYVGDLQVDLHLEKIPGGDSVPEWAALDFQLDFFRRILRSNLKHRGRHMDFIHGVGDGVLSAAVRKELDEVFAQYCVWTPGPEGVTRVTIR